MFFTAFNINSCKIDNYILQKAKNLSENIKPYKRLIESKFEKYWLSPKYKIIRVRDGANHNYTAQQFPEVLKYLEDKYGDEYEEELLEDSDIIAKKLGYVDFVLDNSQNILWIRDEKLPFQQQKALAKFADKNKATIKYDKENITG